MLKENRSLDRGIEILETLAREGAMSLADLHRATGLPKSTIRRLLQTLIQRKIVRRSLADQLYRTLLVFPDISGEVMPKGMLQMADAAIPRALALTQQIGWPSDIHIREARSMRIIDSTRQASNFHVEQGQINRQVSHFGSATGLACLAAMGDGEIAATYEALKTDRHWGPVRFGLDLATLMQRITEIRAQGYAERLLGASERPGMGHRPARHRGADQGARAGARRDLGAVAQDLQAGAGFCGAASGGAAAGRPRHQRGPGSGLGRRSRLIELTRADPGAPDQNRLSAVCLARKAVR